MIAVKGDEIILVTENGAGKLAKITGSLSELAINIRAICAYSEGDKAVFMLVTSDNSKAKEALSSAGTITTEEIIIVEMPDEIGQISIIAEKMKDAGVDIKYVYGTTAEPGKSVNIIFSSNNNDKALEVLFS